MDALIDLLLEWIGQNSTYQTSDMLHPVVTLLTPRDLTREYYSGAAHLLPSDGIDERLNALYAPGDGAHGTIYIIDPRYLPDSAEFGDPSENPLFREILLHELVHHAQEQSGASKQWPCLAMGEAEAYRLGGIYLATQQAQDPLPNRAFWGAVYSRC